jgi:hypothetical protein
VCFFLRSFQRINESFTVLFGGKSDRERGVESAPDEFQKSYGWMYNAKLVSEFENISLNEVWELNVFQFLNDLSYIKVKNKYDADKLERSTRQSNR